MVDRPNMAQAQQNQTGTSITTYTNGFDIICAGLKPLTIHKFYFAGVENTANCVINSDRSSYDNSNYLTANGLLSDASGKLNFTFHTKWPSSDHGMSKIFTIEAPNSFASNTVTLKA